MALRQVVLDFDGTCTLVDKVEEAYRRRYRELCAAEWSEAAAALWDAHEEEVRAASPVAAWTLACTPAAPAAADPYILSGETVALLQRRGLGGPLAPELPGSWYKRAYAEHPAPWRDEIRGLLIGLVAAERRVAFISNSAPAAVGARIDALELPGEVRRRIRIHGGAGKFRIEEPRWDAPLPAALAARFARLPPAADVGLPRPVYLRRGSYFEALCTVWSAEGTSPEETLVVGDVWELDLAMPAALGCSVQLVRRAEPYATYPYELEAMAARGAAGTVTDDLTGVLARVV